MRVESVNVGNVEPIEWEGRILETGFRKKSVEGRVAFTGVNLAGDDQADRSVHGGPRKAVYVYPSEHYAEWRRSLRLPHLAFGGFGENLTTSGWLESDARRGDVVRIGTAMFEVARPRAPCVKMNAVFRRPDMIDRFHRSGRSGFYLAAVQDGELGAGDPIELVRRVQGAPSIADMIQSSRGAGTDLRALDEPPPAGPPADR